MKKVVIALIAVIVVLAAGGGGAYYYFFKMKHHETHAAPPPPKPIMFAQINNLVVSVPSVASSPSGSDDSNGPPTQVYIQLSVQFSTTDPKAVDSFNTLLPIIQSEMVSLLMKKTAVDLMNPNTHAALNTAFLSIVNGVLAQNHSVPDKNPFSAAYITNIVQQD